MNPEIREALFEYQNQYQESGDYKDLQMAFSFLRGVLLGKTISVLTYDELRGQVNKWQTRATETETAQIEPTVFSKRFGLVS